MKATRSEDIHLRVTQAQKRCVNDETIRESVNLGSITSQTDIILLALAEYFSRRGIEFPDYSNPRAWK